MLLHHGDGSINHRLAVERIKELEALLDAQLGDSSDKAAMIENLQKQIAELQKYKLEQDEFEKFVEQLLLETEQVLGKCNKQCITNDSCYLNEQKRKEEKWHSSIANNVI